MKRLLVGAVAVLVLVGACSGGDDDAEPSPSTGPTSSTTEVDRSGIALAGVAGSTTSTVLERGTASLAGTVQGPSGLVPGATVRVERLVAGREVRTDVVTGADGRFLLADVPGGRYRVRAFLAPTLAQLQPEVRFLEDGAVHDFALTVEQQGGLVVRADVSPDTPILGRPVNLVAVVSTRAVDGDGVVRWSPVVGASVELAGLGRWVLRDDFATTSTTFEFQVTTTSRSARSATARTDANGAVRYELECVEDGAPALFLRVPVRQAAPAVTDPAAVTSTTFVPQVTLQAIDLELPACVDARSSATTTTATPTTSG